MSVNGVSHIALGVRNIEESLRFYRDILGLRISKDTKQRISSGAAGKSYERRAVFLQQDDSPDGQFIVLDQHERESEQRPREFADLGMHHFGFWVDDVDALIAAAVGGGFTVELQPVNASTEDFGQAPGGMIRTAIIRDPDGNLVQLDQRITV